MKKIEGRREYLLVEYSEPYRLENVMALMQEVAETCRRENYSKVLVDLSGAEEISIMDGFRLGSKGAETFRWPGKVAVVSQSQLVHFIETVGINRGGNVRMFSEVEKARHWLGVE